MSLRAEGCCVVTTTSRLRLHCVHGSEDVVDTDSLVLPLICEWWRCVLVPLHRGLSLPVLLPYLPSSWHLGVVCYWRYGRGFMIQQGCCSSFPGTCAIALIWLLSHDCRFPPWLQVRGIHSCSCCLRLSLLHGVFEREGLTVLSLQTCCCTFRIWMVSSAQNLGYPPCDEWSDSPAFCTPCCIPLCHIYIACLHHRAFVCWLLLWGFFSALVCWALFVRWALRLCCGLAPGSWASLSLLLMLLLF